MAVILLLVLLFFAGFLAKFEKHKRFYLFKSFILVAIETVIGAMLFLVFFFAVLKHTLNNILLEGFGSLFIVILLIAVANGILLYWFNVWAMTKFKIEKEVQTLCEYIIQWSLIYITVYQVVFDNVVSAITTRGIKNMNIDIANPADLVILVLPSLISVWIAVILYKLRKDNL